MRIDKVEPPYWYKGEECLFRNLQILVYGEDLKDVDVRTELPCNNLRISEGVDSHYLLIYFDIDVEQVHPKRYTFSVHKNKEILYFDYEIREKRLRMSGVETITPQDVVYLIMPDRFAQSIQQNMNPSIDVDRANPNGWHGGNINGITEHLDYLSDLGISTLWLTPVVENRRADIIEKGNKYASYHGYAATDYYQIDKHFGNIEDLQNLVSEAHRCNLKVVMDIVLNHCGSNHVWMKHPPMNDWFNELDYSKAKKTNYCLTTVVDPYRSETDVADTVEGWFTKDMPDLNIENKDVFQYLTQMAVWWIETAQIDAIRVDTYPYVNLHKMKKWQESIHAVYPNLSVIAEAWVSEPAFTGEIQKRNSDDDNILIVMDFAFQKHIEEMLLGKNRKEASYILYNHFVYDYLYKDASKALAFLDNHDLWRWAYRCNDLQKTKQAIGILLTVPRIPQLLYGTELLFRGDGGKTDGSFRQDFPGGWETDKMNKFVSEGRISYEKEMFDFTKKLLKWRKDSKAITKGRMKHFIPQDGVYVYFRSFDKEKVMIIVNCLNMPRKLKLKRFSEEVGFYHNAISVLTGMPYSLDVEYWSIKKEEILIFNLM